jgi:hypothetical protein
MRINIYFNAVFLTVIFIFFLVFSANTAFSAEGTAPPSDVADVEQTKTEILEKLGIVEMGLVEFRHCISAARTEEELLKCHEELKVRRFYEVQDMLFELGMEREERKLRRLVPDR